MSLPHYWFFFRPFSKTFSLELSGVYIKKLAGENYFFAYLKGVSIYQGRTVTERMVLK